MSTIRKVLHGIKGLPSMHVALYLLKGAGDGCRIVHYLRTVPLDMFRNFVEDFDAELKQTFEEVVGLVLSNEQWEQATLSVRNGGIGLCSVAV